MFFLIFMFSLIFSPFTFPEGNHINVASPGTHRNRDFITMANSSFVPSYWLIGICIIQPSFTLSWNCALFCQTIFEARCEMLTVNDVADLSASIKQHMRYIPQKWWQLINAQLCQIYLTTSVKIRCQLYYFLCLPGAGRSDKHTHVLQKKV